MPKSAQKKSISKQLAELDEKVEWFYGDEFNLDRALDQYQQAAKLAAEIEKNLAELKNQVKIVEDFTKS